MKRERIRALKREGGGNYFANPKEDLKFITSGSKVLDLALGGGWARSRIANIVGDKSTGKTLLCIEASANFVALEPKGKVRYREVEAAFDKGYAAALGMPVDRVDFGSKRVDTVEELWDDLEKIAELARGPELVVVDSLDALSDEEEMARDMRKGSYGAKKAKNMSELFRRLVRKLERKDVTVIIVSQVRDKMNVSFGDKVGRSGGRALDFYASQVPYLAHLGRLSRTTKGVKHVTGVEIRAQIKKNKVSLPFREAYFPVLFGWGIDDIASCLSYLKETKSLAAADYKANLTDGDILAISRDLINGPRDEFQKELKHLHQCVEKKWRDVELSLLPNRTKYGK